MLNFILILIALLIAIAYFTIAERKIMAAIQRRKGPNVVGLFGLGQPLADGFKLLIKEILLPFKIEKTIFITAPLLVLILSLLIWLVIPGGLLENLGSWVEAPSNSLDLNVVLNKQIFINKFANYTALSLTSYSLLVVLAISSLNVYGLIGAGWSSYSKYAFLGCLRSSAQMISYEISISLIILPIILITNNVNFSVLSLNQFVFGWNCFFFIPLAGLFFISMLAETNRTPFDLPEAEAELVAGYNVEYSSIIFAMFFLAEYSNMLVMSVVFSILFLGSWYLIFFNSLALIMSLILSTKVTFICFCFILIRALVPRYKYNQLMALGWKFFLPFSLSIFLITFCSFTFFLLIKWQILF